MSKGKGSAKFVTPIVKEALERKSQMEEKASARESVLHLKPIQGTSPKSSIEILRKANDVREHRKEAGSLLLILQRCRIMR